MNRQTLAILLLVGVLAVLGARLFLRSNPHRDALHARELAARGLAGYIARTQPGRRLLIVSNPFTQRSGTAPAIVETEEAGIRGLRLGFGENVVVAYPELKAGALEHPRALIRDPETTTPLSYLVTPDAFDRLAQKHSDCEIIASLIGLPAELNQCEAWRADGPPKFALLFPDVRMAGNAAVQKALKSGKLLAFVLRKPDGVSDSTPAGKDVQSEFASRFVLVTAETLEQVMKMYPNLF